MYKIYFATNNQGKIREAESLLDTPIESAGLDIDEIQSLDSVEVVTKKATAYYEKLNKPILVEDVSLVFTALGRLPGTYINDFSKELGNEGLLRLLENASNREAIAKTTLVFIDKDGKHNLFEGVVRGHISTQLKGENGFGWDPIFIPEGQEKTYAEMSDSEKNKYSMRALAFENFKQWLKQN